MQKLTSYLFALLLGAAALGLSSGPARAAVILNVSGNQLIGAQNVDVLGTLYDVSFVEGTCVAVFGGCDEVSDFTFGDFASAVAAAQALLDQVFLNDLVLGLFDDRPDLTLGCEGLEVCEAGVPFALDPNFPLEVVLLAVAENSDTEASDQVVGTPVEFPSQLIDTTDSDEAVYAVFSRGIAISEPATLLLFGIGLLGVAGLIRRRRQG